MYQKKLKMNFFKGFLLYHWVGNSTEHRNYVKAFLMPSVGQVLCTVSSGVTSMTKMKIL